MEACCHGNQQLKDNSAFVLVTKEEGEKQGCTVPGWRRWGWGWSRDAPSGKQQVSRSPSGLQRQAKLSCMTPRGRMEVRRTFSDVRELCVDSKYRFHCHESDTSQSSLVELEAINQMSKRFPGIHFISESLNLSDWDFPFVLVKSSRSAG